MFRTLKMRAEEKALQARSYISAKTAKAKWFLSQNSGEGLFTDVILVVVIVAVVGAIVYGVLQLFFPDIITGVMDKVQQGIDGIDMFDGK